MGRWRRDDYGYWPRYEKKPARQVKNGLKIEKKIGGTWWSSRWIGVLESFNMGARLGRGKTYARKGQVIDMEIGSGVVRSRVQGSRSTPYKVEIKMPTLTDAQWEKVFAAMASQALFAAKLLAGEMPQNIEEAFSAAGSSLFPKKIDDLQTLCSCPDWANPCKHIAAVYYILGDRFDDDPFLIFTLRGRNKEQVIEALGKLRKADSDDARSDAVDPEQEAPEETAAPIPTDRDGFWRLGAKLDGLTYEPAPPETPETALLILGPAPKSFGVDNLPDYLKPAYGAKPPAETPRLVVKPAPKIASKHPKPRKKSYPALDDPLLKKLAKTLPEPLLNAHLLEMKPPTRLFAVLMNNRFNTVEEVLKLGAADFLKFQGVGRKTLKDLVIELQYFLQERMNR